MYLRVVLQTCTAAAQGLIGTRAYLIVVKRDMPAVGPREGHRAVVAFLLVRVGRVSMRAADGVDERVAFEDGEERRRSAV